MGLTSFTQEVDATDFGEGTVKSDRENKAAFATDFKIGGGFTERFLLYYANRVAWIGFDNALDEHITVAHGTGFVGASYYMQDEAPSVYLMGTIGFSTWSAPVESDSDAWTGFGIGVGIGYEFAPHWSVEGTLNWGNPGQDEFTTNAVSFLVTVSGLAY